MKRMKRIHKVLVIAICLLLSVLGVIGQMKSNQESGNRIGDYWKGSVVTEQQIKENRDD